MSVTKTDPGKETHGKLTRVGSGVHAIPSIDVSSGILLKDLQTALDFFGVTAKVLKVDDNGALIRSMDGRELTIECDTDDPMQAALWIGTTLSRG